MSNLSWKARSSHLRELFSAAFKPVSSRVVFDAPNGRSAGYGFVSFATMKEAEDAVQALDGKVCPHFRISHFLFDQVLIIRVQGLLSYILVPSLYAIYIVLGFILSICGVLSNYKLSITRWLDPNVLASQLDEASRLFGTRSF